MPGETIAWERGVLPILEFLQSSPKIILDGATGTELSRRGVDLSGPSWTAAAIRQAPQTLWKIHREYVDAGANIVTANTFRTHARNLKCLGWSEAARELCFEAVDLARSAADGRAYVAGSQAPLGDCYSPGEALPSTALVREHQQHAQNLADAGVDLLLIETQVSLHEALVATRAAKETGLPVFVSFYCLPTGRVLSGESINEAFGAISKYSPNGILLNCLPVDDVSRLLPVLLEWRSTTLVGAYANTGRMISAGVWEETTAVNPAIYAEQAQQWWSAGVNMVGGCCGTTPEHISAIAKRS